MADYILVVDDEPDVRELFKITLSMAGYEVIVAEDGEVALEAIENEVPQLIVLDLMMPRLDGYGVLDKLRETKPANDLKVLIATAKTINEGDQERLETWPVVGVLNKGELDIAKMVVRVKRILAASAVSPKPAAAPSSDEAKPLTKPTLAPSDETKSPAKPAAPSSGEASPPAKPPVPLSNDDTRPFAKPITPPSREAKPPAKPAAPPSHEARPPAKPATPPPDRDGTKPLTKPATPPSDESTSPASPAAAPLIKAKPPAKPVTAPSEQSRLEPKPEEQKFPKTKPDGFK